MDFLAPPNLALLAVPASLAIVYLLLQRRRRRYALRYSSLAMLREAVGPGPGRRRHVPPVLFLLGTVLLVLAVARPAATVKVPGLEGTVILTIDVSGSMLADDVLPTRMQAAKDAAHAFIERQRVAKNRVRIGIVSFSDNAQIVMGPTLDKTALDDAIDRLKPQRSTAIGRAIITSLDAIYEGAGQGDANAEDKVRTVGPIKTLPPAPPLKPGEHAAASIVLLTDGENNQSPPPLSVIGEAVLRGIRVYTVGVGTPEGAIVTNEGRSARAELDEKTLIAIAEATDAKYFNAQNGTDLRRIYEELATSLVLRDELSEVTYLFAAASGALLLVAACLSLLWFTRLP
jgi:Ca-activated chloride channel family protein